MTQIYEARSVFRGGFGSRFHARPALPLLGTSSGLAADPSKTRQDDDAGARLEGGHGLAAWEICPSNLLSITGPLRALDGFKPSLAWEGTAQGFKVERRGF